MTPYRHLFGPVPSRRFGRSLGVDLTPMKTCTFDCVFCQLGRTTAKTCERKAYVPVDDVLDELDHWLCTDGQADYVTLSGSGEPTLHTQFGKVLDFLKQRKVPSVLLTNGSLLSLPEVRRDAGLADVVKVSLSAWDQDSFEWVNRPHSSLRIDGLVQGQRTFRLGYKGQLWLEVVLLFGINARPADVAKIAALANTVQPDRIHLNTAVRPPAEVFASPLSPTRLNDLCPLFAPTAETITESLQCRTTAMRASEATILALLQRRPCTIEQVADGFNLHINEAAKYLGDLIRGDVVHTVRNRSGIFYTASPHQNK